MNWLSIEITGKCYSGKPDMDSRGSVQARGGHGPQVLKDISLKIGDGEFVCILGPSGCGKTTLLNLVAGLDKDFTGQISLRETTRQRDSAEQHRTESPHAPRVGYVFQNPALLPWRTVGENLRLVMRPDQIAQGTERELLAQMGLADCYDLYPRDLSLGMSRRVALARALVIEPDLLLMDEPFVSLDESKAAELRRLLLRFWKSRAMTVLFVTHDSREAIQLGQRIILLAGSPARVQRDEMVMLTPEQRRDPLYVEALRRQILEN